MKKTITLLVILILVLQPILPIIETTATQITKPEQIKPTLTPTNTLTDITKIFTKTFLLYYPSIVYYINNGTNYPYYTGVIYSYSFSYNSYYVYYHIMFSNGDVAYSWYTYWYNNGVRMFTVVHHESPYRISFTTFSVTQVFDTSTKTFTGHYDSNITIGYHRQDNTVYLAKVYPLDKLHIYKYTTVPTYLFNVTLPYNTSPYVFELPFLVHNDSFVLVYPSYNVSSGIEDGYIRVVIGSMSNGTIDRVYSLYVGNGSDAIKITRKFYHDFTGKFDEFRADIMYPWFAGLSDTELYVLDLENGSWSIYNLSKYGNLTSLSLRLVNTSSGVRIILSGLNTSTVEYTPELMLIDPSSGEVVRDIKLDGYASYNVVFDIGYYHGMKVAYVAVTDYLFVVDVESLNIVGFMSTGISTPRYIDYAEAFEYRLIDINGYTSSGNAITEYYVVGGVGTSTRLSLNADSVGYVGEPVNVSLRLTDYLGNPISNETVLVQEFGGSGWSTLASVLTDSNGSANVSLLLAGRGVHVLRALYNGSDNYTGCYSNMVYVDVYEKVSVDVDLLSSNVPEGSPITAFVSVSNSVGDPVPGVWVNLLVNTSSGQWVVAGTGLTNSAGLAVVSASLLSGTYIVSAEVLDPYIKVVSVNNGTVNVYPPDVPVTNNTYAVPTGRVIAFAPPMSEQDRETASVFAFYYGDRLVDPDSIEVIVYPDTSYNVMKVSTGVYRVTLVPDNEGIYTVLFYAHFKFNTYVGAANFYVYNVTGKLDEWNKTLMAVIDTYEALAEKVPVLMNRINQTVELINNTLGYMNGTTNITTLIQYIDKVNNNTMILLYRIGALQDIINGIGNQTSDIYNLTLTNWENIELLNESIYRLASALQANLSEVKLMVAENGDLLAIINTKQDNIMRYLEDMNATIINTVLNESGELYTLISTSSGTLIVRLDTLLELLAQMDSSLTLQITNSTLDIMSSIGELSLAFNYSITKLFDYLDEMNSSIRIDLETDTLIISSALYNISMSIDQLLNNTQIIQGILLNISSSLNGLIAEIRTVNGTIQTRLDSLDPKIEIVRDDLVVINTSIGRIMANLSSLGIGLDELTQLLNDTYNQSTTTLDELSKIQAKLQDVMDIIGNLPTNEDLTSIEEGNRQAMITSTIGTTLSIIAVIMLVALYRKLS